MKLRDLTLESKRKNIGSNVLERHMFDVCKWKGIDLWLWDNVAG